MEGSRKYVHVFRMRLLEYLAFPIDFLANWAGFPFTMTTYYFLYGTVYQYNPTFAGMDFHTLLVYFFLALCFRRIGSHSSTANDVSDNIQKGSFLPYITRPIHYIGYFFAIQSAKVVLQGLLALPFIIAVPILFIPGYAFNLVPIIQAYMLALLGFGAIFQVFFMVGLLSFWFEAIWGIRHGIGILIWLFSGALIPITIMPDPLKAIAFILPFQHAAGIPAQLILGQKGNGEFVTSALILIVWIILLFLAQRTIWEKGLLKHDGKG
jgi:ABC-2 type transport system permease protein